MTQRLKALSQAGISIWLDDLSRDRLTSGDLQKLIDDYYVVGLTTNPSIFAKAISEGEAYTQQIKDLHAEGKQAEDIIRVLTTDDVRDACDLFRPIYDSTAGYDGRVSIEVDPRLAHETSATVQQAQELAETVGRENVLIKIPATKEGLKAITQTIAAGISVNVTLIFSPERYREVLDAYLSGLEAAASAGIDLQTIHSVASVFVSRTDALIDSKLEADGSAQALDLKGKAGLSVARLCYEVYADVTSSDRWRDLVEAGANLQRPLWASTSTKDPDYPDTMYVEGLITQGCVNTMPEATLMAFADHGKVEEDSVRDHFDSCRAILEAIADLGVDFDEVYSTLESQGVEKFISPWEELIGTVTDQL